MKSYTNVCLEKYLSPSNRHAHKLYNNVAIVGGYLLAEGNLSGVCSIT